MPQQMFVGASWCGTRRSHDIGFLLPKAVMLCARSIMPAMALRASTESVRSGVSIMLRPSFMILMWMCMPLPALPTMIFGENVML